MTTELRPETAAIFEFLSKQIHKLELRLAALEREAGIEPEPALMLPKAGVNDGECAA